MTAPTLDPRHDVPRLRRQLDVVRDYVLSRRGAWLTLREISDATGAPEASVSARLRDLRRRRNGGYEVERRRRRPVGGTWEYRVVLPAGQGEMGW